MSDVRTSCTCSTHTHTHYTMRCTFSRMYLARISIHPTRTRKLHHPKTTHTGSHNASRHPKTAAPPQNPHAHADTRCRRMPFRMHVFVYALGCRTDQQQAHSNVASSSLVPFFWFALVRSTPMRVLKCSVLGVCVCVCWLCCARMLTRNACGEKYTSGIAQKSLKRFARIYSPLHLALALCDDVWM